MPEDISQRLTQIPPSFARIMTHWIFDTNQMHLKGHRRERVKEIDRSQRERERQKEQERQTTVKDTVILPLSHLAVFQVITQVLYFSFSLALLLPLELPLTAQTQHRKHKLCGLVNVDRWINRYVCCH